MDDDLNNVKQAFENLKNKRLKRCLMLAFFISVPGIATFLIVADKSPIDRIPCRITEVQKDLLTAKIENVASCDTTSKITIYKALKAHFKYETIGKMPCDQFDEAEKVLNDMKRHFCP